ncbi:MAG: hypothetical protein CMO29_22660 [Tistrella sp.]|nr:bifunctional aminoglycoside phosphotransferase/ATP-binding protein [uncultured Tistrella sp.]MAM76602.1 hypothetical protein [Tistrella sp.]
MHTEDQSAAIACVKEHLTAGDGVPPRLVETHISLVFIGRTRVLKLKKAVRFPYLDFGTAALRAAACGREVALNRRTAPGIYLGVRRLTAGPDGRVEMEGAGPLVDAVVEMVRFDEDGLLDRLAERDGLAGQDGLNRGLIEALGQAVHDFHAAADVIGPDGGADRVRRVLEINRQGLEAGHAAGLLDGEVVRAVIGASEAAFAAHAALLETRGRIGRVRHGHGDLHLRNIVLIDGRPTAFDCIEFDDDLAITDVLYDLAFLIMDLLHRNRPAAAAAVFNRYLDAGPQDDAGAAHDRGPGLALMPLFLAMRAVVRAHVGAAAAMDASGADRDRIAAEAGAYLDLARRLLAPAPPRLVAVGGFSGSGKSTIAAALAADLGAAPGARIIASDRLRKRAFGQAATTRLPAEAYTPQVSERVYGEMAAEAAAALAAGHSVIADAVFDRADTRARIRAVADDAGLPFDGLWLEAAEAVLVERVTARRGDPSDADADVVRAQLARAAGSGAPTDWHHLAADGAADDRAARARGMLGLTSAPFSTSAPLSTSATAPE